MRRKCIGHKCIEKEAGSPTTNFGDRRAKENNFGGNRDFSGFYSFFVGMLVFGVKMRVGMSSCNDWVN